jgi:hypothetical protein
MMFKQKHKNPFFYSILNLHFPQSSIHEMKLFEITIKSI